MTVSSKGEPMDSTGNSVTAETGNVFLDPAGSEPDSGAEGPEGNPAEGAMDEVAAASSAATTQPGEAEEAAPEPAAEAVDSAALARDLLDQVLQAMGVEANV